jgi:RNA polymerase sigma-70 factor (ECF subfamily)
MAARAGVSMVGGGDAQFVERRRRPLGSAHPLAHPLALAQSLAHPLAQSAAVTPAGTQARADARLEAVLCDALPVLRRFAVRLCDNPDDVYDLLQDTFERAVIQGIPDQVRSTRGWLRRIMFHLFIDGRRAAARFGRVEALEDRHGDVGEIAPDAPEPSWAALTLADIRSALDEIEPVYRDVYSLRMFEYLSYEEIAARLSIERVTVGTRLSRARKRLREVLVRRYGLDVAVAG